MTNQKSKIFLAIRIAPWRLAFWLTLGILLLFALTPRGYAQNQTENSTQIFPYKKQFVISGYYTPLPNQTKYATGSFEGDVRLNGEGMHTADGTVPYPGVAAAPPNFPFGTKIEISGFGIAAIHDRGGAIKGNRLDIWLGHGDEGLRRALGWGMRTVEVTVYGIDPNIKEAVNFTAIPLADIFGNYVRTKYFVENLAYGDSGESVRTLQRFLKKLGFFEGEPTGFFDETTGQGVFKFQLAEKLIENADDEGASNFGPKTRVSLESALERKKLEELRKIPGGTLKRGDSGETVEEIQGILKNYGFLQELQNSGTFDAATVSALTKLQLEIGIVSSQNERGAGFYGPKTKQAIEMMISNYFTPPTYGDNLLATSLSEGSNGPHVEVLQEELGRLNFLRVPTTGHFGKTTQHAVFKFQQTFSLVENEGSDGAGVVGPLTLEKINEVAQNRSSQQKLIAQATTQKKLVAERIQSERVLLAGIPLPDLFGLTLDYGMRNSEIEKLQRTLKRLGFFPGRLTTEYYGDITKQAVIGFQKNHGLEESGAFDEKTRNTLNRIVGGI